MNAFWLAVVPASIAAFISLIGVIYSAIVSRRSIYINSVTTERSKWINALRINISDLIGLANELNIKTSDDDEYCLSDEYKKLSRSIAQLSALIILQLNPDGEIDKNLILLLTEFSDATFYPLEKFETAESLLIHHSQALLKEEWETVKGEARGWVGRCSVERKRNARMQRYRRYAEGKGSLNRLQPN